MDIKQKIEQSKKNIWQAVSDYGAHTNETYVLDDVTRLFVNRLAKDNANAKKELRDLFRKSPVWNEELDCLIINGTRTHNPDKCRVRELAYDILYPARWAADDEKEKLIDLAINFFVNPEDENQVAISAIKSLAPRAYAKNKKSSRVFKALCDKLGVSDDTAGSRFQRLYAQFADELTSKKIDFKLFVSLNPAHFITMSNPKRDNRGDTMTSCHSFNSTEYQYNNGCSGYARDKYSFIVFTVANPNDRETLNNRKTTRQIFAYKPNNGLLLQSRLYNTSGGTYGAQTDAKLYRDLVQREISWLEGAANLWKTFTYYDNEHCKIYVGEGFGGYADWTYEDFDAKLSIRTDHASDYETFTVGTYGLCIKCGGEIYKNLYCEDCIYSDEEEDENICAVCDEHADDLYEVYNSNGNRILVCADCRDDNYTYCDDCNEWYPNAEVIALGNERNVCRRCREAYYSECRSCGDLCDNTDLQDGLCADCRSRTADETETTDIQQEEGVAA